MPDNLDDFDIRGHDEQQRETGGFSSRALPKPGLSLPLAVAAVAMVATLGALFFTLTPRKRASSPPSPPPVPVATPPAAASVVAPALNGSDGNVRRIAAGISSHPEVVRWLARAELVRTLTVVVSNIADGETPRPHLEFLAPVQHFRAAAAKARRVRADPASYSGYDLFGDAIASVDARAAATAFRAAEPLFDAAYRELGHPEGFRTALDRAIQALLQAPVLAPDAPLVPHAIGFRWADPQVEGLTAAQKQFLRMGPRNVQRVQGKLRELEAALSPAPALGEAPRDPNPEPTSGRV